MRLFQAISASIFLALAACGQATAPGEAEAQTSPAPSEASEVERAAILNALSLRANAQGLVENECGDLVEPQFIVPDLGPGVGRAIAFVIGGGQSSATCYGDGPLVMLMRENNGAWGNIYMNRGGPMIILSAQHNNANDLADGGPGFSFPVSEWDGATYVNARRAVPDAALSDARFVP
jgi:hypothetical protein